MTPVHTPATAPMIPTTMPALTAAEGALILFFTVLAVWLVVKLRVFGRQSVVGPKRLPDFGALWPLMVVGVIGFMAWQFGLSLFVSARAAELTRQGVAGAAQNIQAYLTPRDYGIISTIPPAFGALAMIVALRLMFPGSLRWLGLTWRTWWPGAWRGALASLIVGPMVMWASVIMQLVYQRVHYQHPAEHELLRKMGQAHTQSAILLLVLGAVFMAPLLEELLFRGLLQTFLRHGLMRLSGSHPSPAPPITFVPIPAPVLFPPPPLAYATPTPRPVRQYIPRPWHAWIAIVITSLLFASLHDPWMRPIIFVLSLGLGYVYERTGILWASMTVHLLFNLLNTLQYVLIMMR